MYGNLPTPGRLVLQNHFTFTDVPHMISITSIVLNFTPTPKVLVSLALTHHHVLYLQLFNYD